MIGLLASIVGLLLGLGLAKGLFELFDAVGFTLPNSGLVFRDADDRRLAARRRARDPARKPASRDPRDAGAADRRRPRRGDASRRTVRPLPHARLGAAHRRSVSPRSSYGLFGNGLGTTPVLLLDGLGALLVFFGVALLSSRIVRPLVVVLSPVARWAVVAVHRARVAVLPVPVLAAPVRRVGPRPRSGSALRHSSAVRS